MELVKRVERVVTYRVGASGRSGYMSSINSWLWNRTSVYRLSSGWLVNCRFTGPKVSGPWVIMSSNSAGGLFLGVVKIFRNFRETVQGLRAL